MSCAMTSDPLSTRAAPAAASSTVPVDRSRRLRARKFHTRPAAGRRARIHARRASLSRNVWRSAWLDTRLSLKFSGALVGHAYSAAGVDGLGRRRARISTPDGRTAAFAVAAAATTSQLHLEIPRLRRCKCGADRCVDVSRHDALRRVIHGSALVFDRRMGPQLIHTSDAA